MGISELRLQCAVNFSKRLYEEIYDDDLEIENEKFSGVT